MGVTVFNKSTKLAVTYGGIMARTMFENSRRHNWRYRFQYVRQIFDFLWRGNGAK